MENNINVEIKPKIRKVKHTLEEYKVIFPEIEQALKENKKLRLIWEDIKTKYPNFNPKTVTAKYFLYIRTLKEIKKEM